MKKPEDGQTIQFHHKKEPESNGVKFSICLPESRKLS